MPRRSGFVLLFFAVLGAAMAWVGLERTWPILPVDLGRSCVSVSEMGRVALARLGHDVEGATSSCRLIVAAKAIDRLEEAGESVRERLPEGLPLVVWRVAYRVRGESGQYRVFLRHDGELAGWAVPPPAKPDEEPMPARSRLRLLKATERHLGLRVGAWRSLSTKPLTVDGAVVGHSFALQRERDGLLERLVGKVEGGEVTEIRHRVQPRTEARGAEWARWVALSGVLIASIGSVILGVGLARSIRRVALRRVAALSGLILGCLLFPLAFDGSLHFDAWDPSLPRAVSYLWSLGEQCMRFSWLGILVVGVVGFAMLSVSDIRRERPTAAASLARGRVWDRSVALAVARGAGSAMVLAGVFVALNLAFEAAGWTMGVQPRGISLRVFNLTASPLVVLVGFLGVALLEELAYRQVGGEYLLEWTRSRAVAIAVPAVVYALTHATLDFLPPVEPWWGRTLLMWVVGCGFGVIWIRYGIVAAVTAHWLVDIAIFSLPILEWGRPTALLASAVVLLVPLVPLLAWGIHAIGERLLRRP